MSDKKFCFDVCDFECKYQKDYTRHINTNKHIKNTTFENIIEPSIENNKLKDYLCEKCGKKYSDRTGLWRHKKIYNCEKENPNNLQVDLTILYKEKEEIRNSLLENKKLLLEKLEIINKLLEKFDNTAL